MGRSTRDPRFEPQTGWMSTSGCYRQPRVTPKQIGEQWPTSPATAGGLPSCKADERSMKISPICSFQHWIARLEFRTFDVR